MAPRVFWLHFSWGFAKWRRFFYHEISEVISMAFIRLSKLISDIKNLPAPQHDNVVTAAGILYAQHYPHVPMEMLNVIVMALLMDRLLVYEMAPGAINVVQGMRIDDLPEEPPALLRLPWLIESKDVDRPLFGDTVCLGGYFTRGKYFLVGFLRPDGVRVEPWEPEWGKDLKVPVIWSPLVDPEMQDTREEWATQAVSFSLGLGLLLEAEKTPLVAKEAGRSGRKRTRRGGPAGTEWAVRRVVLGKMATRYYGQQQRTGSQELDKSDRVLAHTIVTGHLRYQPYGPGRQQRKWIWIDAYEARRWTKTRTRVEVTGDET